MTKLEKRKMQLEKAGVDSSKFYNVKRNAEKLDENAEKIANGEYVFNRKTDGRFVTAQTFAMLEKGWGTAFRNKLYSYQGKVLVSELKKLARMEREGDATFETHKLFYTKDVVIACVKSYEKHCEMLVSRGVLIDNAGITMARDTLAELENQLPYTELYEIISNFYKAVPKLNEKHFYLAKCQEFKEAYKAKGAYITLLNIIKFHGVRIYTPNGNKLGLQDSIDYVNSLLNIYNVDECLWRMHIVLEVAIKNNNFSLKV